MAYLRRTQEADGSWFGRWGVNYIYGTWQVARRTGGRGRADRRSGDRGRRQLAAGPSAAVRRLGRIARQLYPIRICAAKGRSRASQTAWAVLGLMAAGRHEHPAIARGIRWLDRRRKRADGTWDETEFTGTGFPAGVLSCGITMYRIYFPLLALATWDSDAMRLEAGREIGR